MVASRSSRAAALLALLGCSPAPASASPSLDIQAQVAAYRTMGGSPSHFRTAFYFHKVGVALQTAEADIRECDAYNQGLVFGPAVPDLFPPNRQSESVVPGPYLPGVAGGSPARMMIGGVVVGAISSVVLPAQMRIIAAANLRHCMSFKGYKRYGLSEELWKTLNTGPYDAVVRAKASIASGPQPVDLSLDP